jgi:UDP-N-acetyl-2-amino-2-deoxyglucuronate dehydrogenase
VADPLRIGLIGCGRISRSVYVDLFAGLADHARVVAVCDVIGDRAQEVSDLFQLSYRRHGDEATTAASQTSENSEKEHQRDLARACQTAAQFAPRVYTDLNRLVQDEEVQVVVVTTHPAAHAMASIAAAESGLHVFSEGPLAVHLREADTLIAAVNRSGVKLSVQHATRFFREARQAKIAIETGRLGTIVMGRVDANWYHPQSYYELDGYRGTWVGEGGGSAYHHGRYATDLYLHLMGEPVSDVAAFTGRFLHEIEYEDASTAALRFDSGALGHVTTTICAHRNDTIPYDRVEILGEMASLQVYRTPDWSVTPHATKFSLSVSSEDHAYASELRDDLASAIPPDTEDIQVIQMRRFLESVRDDLDPPIPGESARAHVEVARATYKSAFTGTVVRLPLEPSDPFYGPEGTLQQAT